MNDLMNALWIEGRKAMRSKVPLFTLLGFMMLPLACGFFMFIYQNPDFARDVGMLSAKANLAGGSADWPFYLSMLAQGTAVGGFILFSLVASWVFGREFADGTVKDLLAVPIARGTILAAKFIVVAIWCALLSTIVFATSIILGAALALPLGSAQVFLDGTLRAAVTTILLIALVSPVALFASVGRGYLPAVGMTFLILALANIFAVLGWGNYFPWSIPGMYAGISEKGAGIGTASLWIVALTSAAGIWGTWLWWKYADQSR